MKKKGVAVAVSLALAGIMAASCSACSLFSLHSYTEDFPYDVAVDKGYEGSEESWLAAQDTPSSEARRMYEEAVADGSFTGTYYEFLQSLSWNVPSDDTAYIHEALTSVVSIESAYRTSSGTKASMGSGVIYSLDKAAGDAYIVTNLHVVYHSESYGTESIPHVGEDISVYLYGAEISSRAIEATFVGGAMNYDIAVLRVEGSDFLKESSAQALTSADSDSVTAGERVYAIGNAEGEGISVTSGVLSVDAEYIAVTASDDRSTIKLLEMRTDAAVNHGNSGGGLFNAGGELIGIVNARSEESGVDSFGYAIPANLALAIAQNIIDNRSTGSHGALRATLEVSVQTQDSIGVFDPQTGKYYIQEKVVVTSAPWGGLAARAGLTAGDTIASATLRTAAGTEKTVAITRLHKLSVLLFEARRGDTIILTVSRVGASEPVEVSIALADSGAFTLYGLSVVSS